MLHQQSSAVTVLKKSGGGIVLEFDGAEGLDKVENNFALVTAAFTEWIKNFDTASIDKNVFEAYSARNVTRQLSELLNEIIK